MTGDDSYHAHCFKCRSCHNRIDELMFAKTSHGIYCMKCHHQRVARSRRHAQKQKERENAATAGGPSKSHGRLTKEQSGLSAVCLLLTFLDIEHAIAYPLPPEHTSGTVYPRFSAEPTAHIGHITGFAGISHSAHTPGER